MLKGTMRYTGFGRKKRTMYIKLLLTYTLVVFGVVAILGASLYFIASSTLKKEISAANINTLGKTSELIDTTLRQIDRMALQISLEQNINALINSKISADGYMPSDVTIVAAAMDTISNVVKVNQYIKNVYVFAKESGIVLSSDGGVYRMSNFPDNQWLDYLNNREMLRKWTPRSVNGSEQDKNGENITFVQAIPAFSQTSVGAVVMNVSQSEILDMLVKNSYTGTPDVIVIDNTSKVILKNGTNAYGNDVLEKLSKFNKSGYFTARINGQNSILSCYTSEYTGWKYVLITPEKSVMESIYYLTLYIGILCLFVIILALFAVRRVSSFLYMPVDRMLEQVVDIISDKSVERGKKDEFEYVVSAFNRLNNQKKQLETLINTNSRAIKEKFIRNLLNGYNYTSEQTTRNLENASLKFIYDNFCVMLISIDKFAAFEREYSSRDIDLWKYGIINISEELAGMQFAGAAVDMGEDKIALVINTPLNDYGDNNEIYKLAVDIRNHIVKFMGNTVTIVLSDVVCGFENIASAFANATAALKMRVLLGNAQIIKFADLKGLSPDTSYKLDLNIGIISNYIKSADSDAIIRMISGLAGEMKAAGIYELDRLFPDIIFIIRAVEEQIAENNISAVRRERELYKELYEIETIDQLEAWLTDLFLSKINDICTRQDKSAKYAEEIIDYIEKNYKQEISLEMLADVMGLSVSYVSTIINKELGMSFVNYINKKRINEAKRIMEENDDIPIFKVGELVGYNNIHTFMRSFKKHEGITPGKYKESIAQ